MSESENRDVDQTPPEVCETAENTTKGLLPKQSKEKYLSVYNEFNQWKIEKKFKSLTENVMLAYLTELAEKCKASTLWSRYSMLKSTIRTNDNIDIGTFGKLNAVLKTKSTDGFVSKKSKTLSAEECTTFLTEAPDQQYLATKRREKFKVTLFWKKRKKRRRTRLSWQLRKNRESITPVMRLEKYTTDYMNHVTKL